LIELFRSNYIYIGSLKVAVFPIDMGIETLNKAEGMMQEIGMDYWLRRTQEVLERVEG